MMNGLLMLCCDARKTKKISQKSTSSKMFNTTLLVIKLAIAATSLKFAVAFFHLSDSKQTDWKKDVRNHFKHAKMRPAIKRITFRESVAFSVSFPRRDEKLIWTSSTVTSPQPLSSGGSDDEKPHRNIRKVFLEAVGRRARLNCKFSRSFRFQLTMREKKLLPTQPDQSGIAWGNHKQTSSLFVNTKLWSFVIAIDLFRFARNKEASFDDVSSFTTCAINVQPVC